MWHHCQVDKNTATTTTMATLLETIQTNLDAAIADDAALDAAADAANTTRQQQIDALITLRDAIAKVPEEILCKAVQDHLNAVNETVLDSPATPEVTEDDEPALEVLIEQVVGDAEEIVETPIA